jgi:hypothetical protein
MKKPQFFYEGDTGGGSGSPGAAPAAGATLLASAPAGGDPAAGASPAGSGVAAPAFSWANADGTLDPGWLDKLDGDLKGNASLRSIGTVQDLAKSYVATKQLIGKKLEAPGEGATPEQIAPGAKPSARLINQRATTVKRNRCGLKSVP